MISEAIVLSDNQELIEITHNLDDYKVSFVSTELGYSQFTYQTRVLIIDFDCVSFDYIKDFTRHKYCNVDLLGVISFSTPMIREVIQLVDNYIVFPCPFDIFQNRIEQIEQLRHSANQYMSRVRFDTRSTLSSIRGYAEILEATLMGEIEATSDELLEFSRIVQIYADRASSIIDTMFEHSRIENHFFPINLQEFDSYKLVADFVEEAEKSKLKLFDLTFSSQVTSILVLADSWAVKYLLILITRFLGQNHREPPEIQLSLEIIEKFAQISLFKPMSNNELQMIESSWVSRMESNIANYICTAQDGNIWFESEVGVGTTFYFTLRLVE